jgi:hypothetical protein
MGLDGTTNKQFSVSRETERPKHAQTSRQTDPGLTRGGRIGATAAVAALLRRATNKLSSFKRARVAYGSAIIVAILGSSDTAPVSVKRRTGIGGNRINGTAAHAQVLSLYDPAIIDCIDNAITKKAAVPPAPSAVPPAAAPVAVSPAAAPAVPPAVAVPMAAVAVPMAALAAAPVAAVPVAGVLAVLAVLAVMVRAVPLI